MELQPNETLLTGNGELDLTNLRVTHLIKKRGFHHQNSIFLEDISSVQITLRSQIIFLILAAAGFILGAMMTNTGEEQAGIAFGSGFLFLLLWVFTQTRILSIHPNGGRPIQVRVTRLGKDVIQRLYEQIQQAKVNRVNELGKS